MRETTAHAIALNTAPFGSPAYCRALAALGGVKVRKARVFAMADPGYLSSLAADRLTAALRRYAGMVPCGYVGAYLGLATFHAAWASGHAATLGAALARAGYRVHVIDGHSDGSAHGSLAAALGLPPPVVGAGQLDPVALLEAMTQPPNLGRIMPGERVAIVVAVPMDAPAAAWTWAGALLRACGGCYVLRWVPTRLWPPVAPRWHVVVVTDGPTVDAEALAARRAAVDGVMRLDLGAGW